MKMMSTTKPFAEAVGQVTTLMSFGQVVTFVSGGAMENV
ncbi:hypothetical protein Pint_32928 [Pistacia integerrima]|uniref:Uncharacterized protein n=1 Tax=Pistacia integerrima TaxID=434235 RepID=A0ACC0X9F2_9ROSI|nr:hypothetical protein Pint_32928 [Pistacia integerrima]